jgi:hypothetical protein
MTKFHCLNLRLPQPLLPGSYIYFHQEQGGSVTPQGIVFLPQTYKSKSKSRYDWRSVSQYVLMSRPFWFSWLDYCCVFLGRPLWREVRCVHFCKKSKSHYNWQSVGQSVLVSGAHLGPVTNSSFSLKFYLDSCGFVIL